MNLKKSTMNKTNQHIVPKMCFIHYRFIFSILHFVLSSLIAVHEFLLFLSFKHVAITDTFYT